MTGVFDFNKVTAGRGVNAKRGSKGSQKTRVVGGDVNLDDNSGILNFLFKNLFVGMGLAEVAGNVDHNAVLNSGDDG